MTFNDELMSKALEQAAELSDLRAALTAAQEEAQRTRELLEDVHEERDRLREALGTVSGWIIGEDGFITAQAMRDFAKRILQA